MDTLVWLGRKENAEYLQDNIAVLRDGNNGVFSLGSWLSVDERIMQLFWSARDGVLAENTGRVIKNMGLIKELIPVLQEIVVQALSSIDVEQDTERRIMFMKEINRIALSIRKIVDFFELKAPAAQDMPIVKEVVCWINGLLSKEVIRISQEYFHYIMRKASERLSLSGDEAEEIGEFSAGDLQHFINDKDSEQAEEYIKHWMSKQMAIAEYCPDEILELFKISTFGRQIGIIDILIKLATEDSIDCDLHYRYVAVIKQLQLPAALAIKVRRLVHFLTNNEKLTPRQKTF